MASETERTILDQDILLPVGKTELRSSAEQKLVGFLAMKGARYNGKLMVVGRAGNGGFADGIALSALASPSECVPHSREVLKKSNGDGACPMQWVNERRKDNSAFWRVIRQVVERLDIVGGEDFDNTWPSHLVWSNLYKVSPAEEGNPGVRLCSVQWEGCKKLLEHEIKTYKPVRLLFLTGWEEKYGAEAFLDFLPEGDIQPFDDKDFVKASGFTRVCAPDIRTRVVVAVHPQGKKEDKWVEDVVAELQNSKKSRDMY